MATLALYAQRTGRSVAPGQPWSETDVEGGLPRTRAENSSGESQIEVQFICTATQYDYLMQFVEANRSANYEPFTFYMLFDTAEVVALDGRLKPETLKLVSQKGSAYTVTMSLLVLIEYTQTQWPT